MQEVWIIQRKEDVDFDSTLKAVRDKLYRYDIITPKGFEQLCKDFGLTCGWKEQPTKEQMDSMVNLVKVPFP